MLVRRRGREWLSNSRQPHYTQKGSICHYQHNSPWVLPSSLLGSPRNSKTCRCVLPICRWGSDWTFGWQANLHLGKDVKRELMGAHSKAILGSSVPHPHLEWMDFESKMLHLHGATEEDMPVGEKFTLIRHHKHMKGTIHHNCDVPGCTSSLAGRSFLPTPHQWLETTFHSMQTLLFPPEH